MDRLTIRNGGGSISQPTNTTVLQVFQRLAEYEDTGLAPEEIRRMLKKIDDVYRRVEKIDPKTLEHLSYLVDAEEQGRLIVLPCKAGDTLWFNTYKHGECIGVKPHKVEDVEVSFRLERDFGDPYTSIPDWRIGETAFLTKEEAEAELETV